MKPRDYCCCAIPVMNVGIYVTLFEQFLLALLVAILALATPGIVGASVPGFGKAVLAVICFVACAVQLFGFFGVFREKPIMFRRYTTLHILLTVAAFSVALAWIIISASKHSTAVSTCETNFFSNNTSTATASIDEGQTLCNIFTWVDVGLMGGLWLILAIMQFYLYTVVSSYGTAQSEDHDTYKSIYNVNGLDNGIPLANRSDPWDARPSVDDVDGAGSERVPLSRAGHGRSGSVMSDASVSTILAEKQQEPRSYIGAGSGYPPPPSGAYTQAPQPTPYGYGEVPYNNYNNYTGGPMYGGMEQPGRVQSHPAEGQFGRKTPRYQAPY